MDFGLELYPHSESTLYSLAEASFQVGEYQDAKEVFEKLNTIQGDTKTVNNRLQLIDDALVRIKK